MSTIYISKKDELYTFHELEYILKLTKELQRNTSSVLECLEKMLNAFNNQTNSMAVFFMPESTFQIFSMLQGDISICNVDLEFISVIKDAVMTKKSDNNKDFMIHLSNKIDVLYKYLADGNFVKPVLTPADNLMTFDLL